MNAGMCVEVFTLGVWRKGLARSYIFQDFCFVRFIVIIFSCLPLFNFFIFIVCILFLPQTSFILLIHAIFKNSFSVIHR